MGVKHQVTYSFHNHRNAKWRKEVGTDRQTDTNRQGDTQTQTQRHPTELEKREEWRGRGNKKGCGQSACGVQVNSHAADNRRLLVQRIMFRPARVVSLGRHFYLFPAHTRKNTFAIRLMKWHFFNFFLLLLPPLFQL